MHFCTKWAPVECRIALCNTMTFLTQPFLVLISFWTQIYIYIYLSILSWKPFRIYIYLMMIEIMWHRKIICVAYNQRNDIEWNDILSVCITLSFYELFTRPKMDMMQFFRMKHGSLNGWCRLLSSNYTNWLIVWRKYTNYCSMWESTMAWAAFIYLTDLCLFVLLYAIVYIFDLKQIKLGVWKLSGWGHYWWMAKENTQPQNMSS